MEKAPKKIILMPAIRILGRKWLFATDDLVFPSLIEIPYRIFWLAFLCIILKEEYSATWLCVKPTNIDDVRPLMFRIFAPSEIDWNGLLTRLFLCGTLALQAVYILSLIALASQSGRGTITDTRKYVVPLLLWNLFLIIPEVLLNIIGTIWIFSDMISCQLTSHYASVVVHSIVIMNWVRLALMLLLVYLMYDPLGTVNYDELSSSKQAWFNRKLTKTFAWRLKWALLLLRGDEHSKEAIQEIARLLATLFRSSDLVQSDIIAGCILLRIRQKRWCKINEGNQTDDNRYCTDVFKFFEGCPRWMNLKDAFHYMNLSTAAYGWMYVLFKNFFSGLCLIAPYIRCFCQRMEPDVTGDNCCMCNYAGLKYVSKVADKDIIHISFTNKVFEVPFYIVADHERKNIVVIIRGTISVPDVFTDLTGTCEPFEVEGLPPGSRAHRGMAMGAAKTMQRIMPLLEKAFQEHPNFGLVVTGHSLGAAISILLGIRLKPHFPNVKVFAFSAPSGLLSREACKYTESFVMMVGVGDDVVMRLSILSVESFRDKLVQALNATRLPKYQILLKGLGYLFRHIPDSDLDSAWKSPDNLEAMLLDSPVMPRAFPESDRLYNAGRILHITKNKSTGKSEPKYRMTWASPEEFRDIMVMPRMLFDHMPENVHHAIKTALEEHRANPVIDL
ncbi:diacylglycerol lipase-beta-like isoform X2 [Plodia interpunctella]|uniref:diacylglycerol lipase-beta-like isoform X2 n=1 Tax=Plodia interpunctella TaxID=58824 RepID=UPI0023686ED8|nr:diacylglycerol lipase-beta-like isoform X2 [Plodia interpunctella]